MAAAQSGNVELFDWLVPRFNIPPDEVDAVSALSLVGLGHSYICRHLLCIHRKLLCTIEM